VTPMIGKKHPQTHGPGEATQKRMGPAKDKKFKRIKEERTLGPEKGDPLENITTLGVSNRRKELRGSPDEVGSGGGGEKHSSKRDVGGITLGEKPCKQNHTNHKAKNPQKKGIPIKDNGTQLPKKNHPTNSSGDPPWGGNPRSHVGVKKKGSLGLKTPHFAHMAREKKKERSGNPTNSKKKVKPS